MTNDEKPDADEIRAFLRELRAASWLDERRRRWPEFLFHVTDVRNAASILGRGELLSRNEVKRLGIMSNDNAAPEIIAATTPEILDAVRLYFRPRTPTAYNNEGIRPGQQRIRGSHCPIPVMFVFNAAPILAKGGVRFSNGSLARHGQARIGETAAFLREIPFQQVYHDRSFSESEHDDIIFRRQAEVIVPKHLALDPYLLRVYTRSPAEMEMLEATLERAMADSVTTLRYRPVVDVRSALFFKSWTYLERVTIVDANLRLEFNPSSMAPGPFTLTINITDIESTTRYFSVKLTDFVARGVSTYRLQVALPSQVRIRIHLDDILAYDAVRRGTSELMRNPTL